MFEYVAIGRVLKPFRQSGEILVQLEARFITDIKECKAVFLKINGLQVPFFVEYAELDPDTGIIKLEELNSPEEIKPFNGEEIFLRKEDLTVDPEDPHPATELVTLTGYMIVDVHSGLQLSIESVEEYPQQLMAVVSHNGKECLIPLAEELILGIDPSTRTISMELPGGLLD